MAISEAYVLEVIVLTTSAHAFLRGGCSRVVAFLQAQEHVFELIHPGVGEQQSAIVRRNEGRRMNRFVPVLDKIIQKFAPNLGSGKHTDARTFYLEGQFCGDYNSSF